MFNLEQSIAEWRQQMLTAGIKTPVPLEELESHLREEIDESIKSGTDAEQAFEMAAQQIGQGELLRTEFRNAGFLNWWGGDAQTRINRALALLWLAYCVWRFLSLGGTFVYYAYHDIVGSIIPSRQHRYGMTLGVMLMGPIYLAIFLGGIFASSRLFGGKNKAIRTIKFIAVLNLVNAVWGIVWAEMEFAERAHMEFARPIMVIVFSVASLFLLRSPSRKDPGTATQ